MADINMKYEFIILIHSINNMLVNYFCMKSQYVLEDTKDLLMSNHLSLNIIMAILYCYYQLIMLCVSP